MNTPADESRCAQVPLRELLRGVPIGHTILIRENLSSHNIPIGRYVHEAADTIERLQAELNQAIAERDAHKSRVELLEHDMKSGDYESLYAHAATELNQSREREAKAVIAADRKLTGGNQLVERQ